MTYEIPGFEILEHVGSSCMTDVWKAYQQSLQRTVSIKVLKPEYAAHADEVRQFIDEAKRTARLNHANIIAIYDAVEDDPASFLVMEYVAGPSVADLLSDGKPMAAGRALRIAEAVAGGLCYAWDELNMIHRNITPRSMRIDHDGAVKLSYVGISLRVDPLNPGAPYPPDAVAGTPYYMAPEQAAGSMPLDCRSDMYALGACLYHMLTGRMPFGDLTPMDALRAQQTQYLTPPKQLNPEIPRNVVAVMERLMMRNRDDRYATWDGLIAELRKIAASRVVIHKRATPVDCVIIPPRRNWTKPGVAADGRRAIVIRKSARDAAPPPQAPQRRIRLVKRTG